VHSITVNVNGESYQREVADRILLVDFLREDLRLTGTKVGCAHGVCGSCTVHVDDVPVRSCLKFAVQVDGREVLTVESLADREELNALQQAFRDEHGLQCGFCTPGFLMTATAFIARGKTPDDKEIREALAGNICRCTGYESIVAAVASAIRSAHATAES
jgi:aerobic-type carbon monoxide dehydrogenase small subunit (CoxS/CutS family)